MSIPFTCRWQINDDTLSLETYRVFRTKRAVPYRNIPQKLTETKMFVTERCQTFNFFVGFVHLNASLNLLTFTFPQFIHSQRGLILYNYIFNKKYNLIKKLCLILLRRISLWTTWPQCGTRIGYKLAAAQFLEQYIYIIDSYHRGGG